MRAIVRLGLLALCACNGSILRLSLEGPPGGPGGPGGDPPPVFGGPLATYALGAGEATFGLALPAGAASEAVAVGTLYTQTDVKTRWPDGSIRFAVVSASVPAAGEYILKSAGAATGSFAPESPDVQVRFTIGNDVWVAALPPFDAADAWLSGAVVQETRATVSPSLNGTPHPLLQVLFDVRSYASGGHRIDITVQNTKDILAGDRVFYDVSVDIGGASVFSRSGVAHHYLTRWRKIFPTEGLVEAEVVPDFEPFHLAGAIPRFLPTVENATYETTGPNFDIFKFGLLSPYGMAPGGRVEIGPFPFWVAQYVVHKGASQREALLRHGDLSASWPQSITEADGKTLITLESYPDYWIDGRAGQGHPFGPEAPREASGAVRGIAPDPAVPDTQHMASLNYVPYLVTGDRFYIDQLKFIASWGMLYTWPGPSAGNGMDFSRQAGEGILSQNGDRGMGWAFRELASAAAYLPDADPQKSYFVSRMQNNLDFLQMYATTSNGGPLGVTFWEMNSGGEGAYYAISLWRQSYLAWAVDHAAQQGFGPTQAFRDRVVGAQIRFLTSGPEYPPEFGAPYYPRIGRVVGGQFQFFTTMAQVFSHNHGDESGIPPGELVPGGRLPQPMVGYYGPEARLLVALGVREGLPGAQQALDFLTAYREPGTGASIMGDVNRRSGFAVAP